MWAALVARLNQGLGARIGFLTPLLYLFRNSFGGAIGDVLMGDNGPYRARQGWDPCCGWGSPDGETLLDVLRGVLKE